MLWWKAVAVTETVETDESDGTLGTLRNPAGPGRRTAGMGRVGLVTVAGVVVLGVVGWPGWWQTGPGTALAGWGGVGDALVVLEVGGLLWWRSWPLGCFALAETGAFGYATLGFAATPAGYAGLVATGIVAWRDPRAAVRVSCLAIAAAGIVTIGVLRSVSASPAAIVANLLLVGVAEPVKAFETRSQDFFCASVWMVGLLIHATVGSLGGVGRRPQKRCGLAA